MMDDDPLAKSLKTQRLSFITRLRELEQEVQNFPVAAEEPRSGLSGSLAEEDEPADSYKYADADPDPEFRADVPAKSAPVSPVSNCDPHEFRSRPRQRLDRALSFMALNRIPGDDEIYVGG